MVWVRGPSSGPSAGPGIGQCTSLTSGFSLGSEGSDVSPVGLSARPFLLIPVGPTLDLMARLLSVVLGARVSAVVLMLGHLPVPPPKVGEGMGWMRCSALSPAAALTHELLVSSCALRI